MKSNSGYKRFKRGFPLFSIEKPPYLLILILSVLGFQLKYFIADIKESPLIEYKWNIDSVRYQEGIVKGSATCNITNLSRCKVLSDMNFEVLFNEKALLKDAKWINASVKPFPPASPVFNEEMDLDAYSFKIDYFQPESKYILKVDISNKGNELQLPTFYILSKNSYLLVKAGIYSSMVKYQFYFNLSILILIITVAIVYFIFYIKFKRNEARKTQLSLNTTSLPE